MDLPELQRPEKMVVKLHQEKR